MRSALFRALPAILLLLAVGWHVVVRVYAQQNLQAMAADTETVAKSLVVLRSNVARLRLVSDSRSVGLQSLDMHVGATSARAHKSATSGSGP